MKKIYLFILLSALFSLSVFAQPTVNVTFKVDLGDITPSVDGVHVAGSFQNWDPAGTPMSNVLGTVWTVTHEVPINTQILFKYINGNDWPFAESVPSQCGQPDGYGGYNRYLDVLEEDIVLNPVCFGECVPCTTPDHDITFQVDMSEETVSELGVHVAGSFNGWSPSADEMIDQGSGIYAITLQLQEGTYHEYKFINGNDWGTPGEAQEIVPSDCGVDDGSGGYNRYTTIPDQDSIYLAVCYGSCVECAATNFSDVTFIVDMSNETVSPEGVHMAGSFNGWSPDATAMEDNLDGTWQVTLNLQEGNTIQYKFINGITWDDTETIWGLCNVGGNREVIVPEDDLILDLVCFGKCNICNPPMYDVTFLVDMSEQMVSGDGVHFASDLQGWDPSTTQMTEISDDVYEVTLSVGEGDYHEFKYVNGMTWDDAEFVPEECNRNGNRWLVGPSEATTLNEVCFNSCEDCVNFLYSFDLTVNLEGPYTPEGMYTSLFEQGMVPTEQPYNTPPWSYDGQETLSATSDVVDWVIVEMRETDGDASTATPNKFIDRQAAILLSNGAIVQPDGVSPILYTGNITQNLFILIHHRNHLSIMSAVPLVESKGNFVYDFTVGPDVAYQNGQKNLGGSVYGMYGGDADASGTVDMDDLDLNWDNNAGTQGYQGSDLNMNGQSNNPDKNDVWEPNQNIESQVPGEFECGDALIDERDGQSYQTVLIGDQCWMAENINIGTMINGNSDQIDNQIIEKYCFEDLVINCDEHGGLYQWAETMQYVTSPGAQGICPDGWHIPTDGEWCTLENEVDSGEVDCDYLGYRGNDAGANLKETGTFHWNEPNYATNSSGFSALGSGYRNISGYWYNMGRYGFFWVSAGWGPDQALGRQLKNDSNLIRRYNFSKTAGYSIRCLKN